MTSVAPKQCKWREHRHHRSGCVCSPSAVSLPVIVVCSCLHKCGFWALQQFITVYVSSYKSLVCKYSKLIIAILESKHGACHKEFLNQICFGPDPFQLLLFIPSFYHIVFCNSRVSKLFPPFSLHMIWSGCLMFIKQTGSFLHLQANTWDKISDHFNEQIFSFAHCFQGLAARAHHCVLILIGLLFRSGLFCAQWCLTLMQRLCPVLGFP